MRKPLFPSRLLALYAVLLAGLFVGSLFAAGMDSTCLSLMRRAMNAPVSIVVLVTGCVLPFLIAAYAVMIERFSLLLILIFLRCAAFGFVTWAAAAAFGSAAWLLQPMLQFTDCAALTALAVYASRRCMVWKRGYLKELCILAAIAAAVAVIDFTAVAPFLASLPDL